MSNARVWLGMNQLAAYSPFQKWPGITVEA
jgi:hypothetical protein